MKTNYFEKVKKESREDFEIIKYDELLNEALQELENTNPNDVLKYWFNKLNEKLWYITPWQLILIWWITWTWKTTFANSILKSIAKEGHKVWRFILEDRQEDLKKQELYYSIVKLRKEKWYKKHYPIQDFLINNIKNTELVFEKKEAVKRLKKENENIYEVIKKDDKVLDLEKLEILVKELINRWCKIILLDHLQEFKVEWDELRYDLKIESMMYKIKAIARKYKISIILIAHYAKLWWKKPDDESFKNSWAITQVANKVIHLYRDKTENNWLTEIIISKNRWEWWTWTLYWTFEIESFWFIKITDLK